MKLEDQVVSLELAKRLKELGVKQESYFVWHGSSGGTDFTVEHYDFPEEYSGIMYSAFTVAELGEMLPWLIKNQKTRNNDTLKVGKNAYGHWVCCYHTTFAPPLVQFIEPTEADARAKMLIYLIENNLINV